jgi:signal transduction histidine kinase
MLHPDDVERTRAGFELTQQGQPAIRFPNRYRRKDGTYRWISWVGVPEEGMVYCSGRDITEEKAAEADLAKTQEALRQAQKMEAIGQLTGGIAHDFNNLLAGISGSLELLERRLAEGRLAGVERYIVSAQSSARRAAALTQRLLAFSRRQTLDPKPTNVNRLISGMEDLIRRTVGPAIDVEVVGAGGLWTTKVDSSQLESALLNLCINARDAMPKGGRITIETANKWLDERAARERELPPGQYVSLCVTDNGAGMTPDVISHAFDPFFTTKPLGQGTGLGLSMIHGFVRQSGGQVRIYSELGKGTTMCLYFPRFIGPADEVDQSATIAVTDSAAGESILIIDDEPTIRMLMMEVLEEAGYVVMEAGDGAAGLKILQSDARIDLLITDVGLPGGLNGRQVADAARMNRPDLKVLFITGFAENAALAHGHLGSGMHLIAKPFVMAAFANKVAEIIEA